ncbi:MAG: dihydroorotase [Lachnospiraceae bacterium]|nr:dihydroorotase [Lachnospiraceae bacterium]
MLLIKKGRVINPATGVNDVLDVLIEDGIVTVMERDIKRPDCRVIDASGCFVMPGFIDLHVHLRTPGQEYKEDMVSGTKAAAKGGVTTVVAMPNTKPVVGTAETVNWIKNKAKEDALVNVCVVGCITKDMAGKELSDIEAMIDAGICALSEDGKSVMDSGLYRKAMKIAAKRGIPVLAHCEDINLVEGGVMNLDENSKRLGLQGISNAVEDIIAARDILIAKETGAKLHLCHCSTKLSAEMIRKAVSDGVDVSGEVCPHHFTLTSDDIKTNDSAYKMNPPLRGREDKEALIAGLKNNIFNIISTDHAPHSAEEKAKPMEEAPFGIVGLETSAALTYTELVDKGIISISDMVMKMSTNPAGVLGIDKGDISPGHVADIVIFDPQAEYTIDKESFVSKGKNTPFDGRRVKGRVEVTVVGGKVVYERGEFV